MDSMHLIFHNHKKTVACPTKTKITHLQELESCEQLVLKMLPQIRKFESQSVETQMLDIQREVSTDRTLFLTEKLLQESQKVPKHGGHLTVKGMRLENYKILQKLELKPKSYYPKSVLYHESPHEKVSHSTQQPMRLLYYPSVDTAEIK